ncbi:MAG: WbqC family protein [Porphyromonas sp.]|nr:WbqC family protein [Porphyromonas sp.]
MIFLPSSTIPSILYISSLLMGESVAVFIDEPYSKQSYRNRFDIYGATGRMSISVPVEKYSNPAPPTALISISEHGEWRRVAEQSLRSAYSSSPYYEYYEEEILRLLYNPTPLLVDYNEAWLNWICGEWHIPAPIHVPEDENVSNGKHLQILCDRQITKHPPIVFPHYYQTFGGQHGFLPNLSSIDLLCNLGPEGILTLKETAQKWKRYLQL